MIEIVLEGEDAYYCGIPRRNNPYEPGTDERMFWDDGWLGAQEDEECGANEGDSL